MLYLSELVTRVYLTGMCLKGQESIKTECKILYGVRFRESNEAKGGDFMVSVPNR